MILSDPCHPYLNQSAAFVIVLSPFWLSGSYKNDLFVEFKIKDDESVDYIIMVL